jgi:hypothetical protein
MLLSYVVGVPAPAVIVRGPFFNDYRRDEGLITFNSPSNPEMTERRTCPKCERAMEQGFIPNVTRGQLIWYAGVAPATYREPSCRQEAAYGDNLSLLGLCYLDPMRRDDRPTLKSAGNDCRIYGPRARVGYGAGVLFSAESGGSGAATCRAGKS